VRGVAIARWAAWAPGLEDRDAWEDWCRHPRALGADGTPDIAFLPPLLRRRCGRLSRMMLRTALACGAPDELATVPTVFASRHGDLATTVALLQCLARDEPVSANRFSHSVHNTQAGLFSIVTGNRQPASALAAGRDTFRCAFLEALNLLRQATAGRVLLVIGDEPLPAVFAPFADEPQAAYATAFLLEASAGREAIVLDATGQPGMAAPAVAIQWPAAVEFLRWLRSRDIAGSLSGEASAPLR
jgi:hypothetical protein